MRDLMILGRVTRAKMTMMKTTASKHPKMKRKKKLQHTKKKN